MGGKICYECQKLERVQNRFFSFLNPLAVEIWLSIIVAYVLVSLTIWIVARFSPFEWQLTNTTPCSGRTIYSNEHGHGHSHGHDYGNVGCSHGSMTEIHTNKLKRRSGWHFHSSKSDIDNCEKTLLMQNQCDRYSGTDDSHHRMVDGDNYIGDRVISGHHEHHLEHRYSRNEERNSHYQCYDSDAENDQDHECDGCGESELLCSENDFTLKNSFWFAIGTLMQQGSDLNPKVLRIY